MSSSTEQKKIDGGDILLHGYRIIGGLLFYINTFGKLYLSRTACSSGNNIKKIILSQNLDTYQYIFPYLILH